MRGLILLLMVIILLSCSKKSVEGIYTRKFETLILNNDFTYDYQFRVERSLAASKGTWQIVGPDRIQLKSKYDLEHLPVEVKEAFQTNQEARIIIEPSIDSLLNRRNIEYVFVVNGVEQPRQKDQLLIMPSFIVKSIKIKVYHKFNELPVIQVSRDSIITETYKVKETKSNLFILRMPIELDMFNSETVKSTLDYEGNKLYWLEKGKAPFKKKK